MNSYWLRGKIHQTWHFTASCLGVLVGVALAQWWHSFSEPIWVMLGAVLIVSAIASRRRSLVVVAIMGGLLCGLWRGSVGQELLQPYHAVFGTHVQMSGRIEDDLDTDSRGQAVLHLVDVLFDSRQLGGKLWVTVDGNQARTLQRGDHMTIDGELKPGFGNFAGTVSEARIVKVSREDPGDIALSIRNDVSRHISQAIDEPAASLGIGYLLGQKRGLPDALVEALKIVGLTHIVVASGYNLTILVRLARRLFEKVSKYLSALSGVLLIALFISMTGLSPSMTRAGIVSLLSLWAWYYGRRFHPITLLAFAAMLTVLWNPSYVWGDLGWALSFAAFGGVMIVAPLMQTYFYGVEKPHLIPQIIGETIAAQVATAPIILFAFGQFSNIALLSNLLILPFVPLAMLLTLVAGIGAYVAPGAAGVIGWPAEMLLRAMIWIIEHTATIEWAQSQVQLAWWGLIGWYVLLGLVCLYMKRRTGFNLYKTSIVE
jgi:competence protein ComEC